MSSSRPHSKPVIGIVGGVGSGKSTAAAAFERLGCARIDADAIAHEMLGEADIRQAIRRRWGLGVFAADGQVDRKALAEVVFDDEGELAELNRLLHPGVCRRMRRRIDEALADPATPAVVVDAPVLLEAGCEQMCTDLVFIVTDPSQRRQRVANQRGWDTSVWEKREKRQISLDIKRAKCDHIVDNRSSVSHLREQIRLLFQRICPDVD